MKLYAVFPHDESNTYPPTAAVSRPYKRKAAAEQLADKMNVAPNDTKPFVVREYRGIHQPLTREQVLSQENRRLQQRVEQLEGILRSLSAEIRESANLLEQDTKPPGCLQPLD